MRRGKPPVAGLLEQPAEVRCRELCPSLTRIRASLAQLCMAYAFRGGPECLWNDASDKGEEKSDVDVSG